MSLFNEIAVSLYLYIMLALTEFSGENPLRDELGWSLFILISFTILFNLLKALTCDLITFKQLFLKKWSGAHIKKLKIY